LDRINIIEQEDKEFVSFYNNKYINEINNSNNNINEPHIDFNIRIYDINYGNTEDELNNKSENLFEAELSYDKKVRKGKLEI